MYAHKAWMGLQHFDVHFFLMFLLDLVLLCLNWECDLEYIWVWLQGSVFLKKHLEYGALRKHVREWAWFLELAWSYPRQTSAVQPFDSECWLKWTRDKEREEEREKEEGREGDGVWRWPSEGCRGSWRAGEDLASLWVRFFKKIHEQGWLSPLFWTHGVFCMGFHHSMATAASPSLSHPSFSFSSPLPNSQRIAEP